MPLANRCCRLTGWCTAWLTVATVLLVGAGCAVQDQPAVAETGAAFQNALRGNDLAGACRLLSEETRNSLESASTRPCPVALAALKLPTGAVRSTEVWGGNGQIQLQNGTLFLAQFDTGWRITAAGCTPRPDRPYDCDLKG